MTPAAFTILRESLGLPIPWLAEQCGVGERTARYWGTGRSAIPDDAIHLLVDLEAVAATAAHQALVSIEQQIKLHGRTAEPVLLVAYRTDAELWQYRPDMEGLPAQFHRAILGRVRVLAAHIGVEVVAEWLDAEAYQAWLKAKNQHDSEENHVFIYPIF